MKRTVRVHCKPDGSRWVVRLWNGQQHYDRGKVCQHWGHAKHLIEKGGGWVEEVPDPGGWDEGLHEELTFLLGQR
jgi:hypothetical protein